MLSNMQTIGFNSLFLTPIYSIVMDARSMLYSLAYSLLPTRLFRSYLKSIKSCIHTLLKCPFQICR